MNELAKIENSIIIIRDEAAVLDSDVASFYGVETKRVNEAVRNNPEKFPPGYVINLNGDEWENLKSKFSTSSWGGKNKLPSAFTEKGLYMLATILRSSKATQTTLAIIEAFTKIRELGRNVQQLINAETDEQKRKLMEKNGEIITGIFGDALETSESETTIEINFALLKFKHTVKKTAPKKKSKKS